jgi:hypothetical protein
LDQIILRALAKNPEDRFASISDFRKAVSDFTQGKRVAVGNYPSGQSSWLQRNVVTAMILSALFGGLVMFAIQSLLLNRQLETSDGIEELEARVEFLTLLNDPELDFDRIAKVNIGELTPKEKLALLNKATSHGELATALDIAENVADSTGGELSIQSRFGLAEQLMFLGKVKDALKALDVTPEKFDSFVAENPDIESYRPLLCELLIANGSPSLARVVNLNGPNETKLQKFKRDLTECEIRVSNLWFEGLEEKMEALGKRVASLSLNDKELKRYSRLSNQLYASSDELHEAIINSQSQQQNWQRSEFQLALAKRLLEQKEQLEGANLLAELVDQFLQRGLPTHPIVQRALITAEKHKVGEIDIAQWWSVHGDDVELGTTVSFELFAIAANRIQDPEQSLKILIPHLDSLEQEENASVKVSVVRAIWLAGINHSNHDISAQLAGILESSAKEILEKDSVEFLESQAIVSTILRSCSLQKSIEENQRFFECTEVLGKLIQKNDDNIASVFLRAPDTSSPSTFFRARLSSDAKSNAEWIREFMYHRYNKPSDQLEMVAFFSEEFSNSNPDEVRRMLVNVEDFQANSDWGPKGAANWERIATVKNRLAMPVATSPRN